MDLVNGLSLRASGTADADILLRLILPAEPLSAAEATAAAGEVYPA